MLIVVEEGSSRCGCVEEGPVVEFEEVREDRWVVECDWDWREGVHGWLDDDIDVAVGGLVLVLEEAEEEEVVEVGGVWEVDMYIFSLLLCAEEMH